MLKKFVLIPDSFKGTMSSGEICSVMEKRIRCYYPNAEFVSIPVADGGEGSVDSFLAAVGGEKIKIPCKGPYMEDMEGFYGIIDNGKTAVVEMAAAAGLPLVGDKLAAEKTTTYGVGQLLVDAARRGCKKIVTGLGGSATNDFGTGAAAAAGVRFLDKDGKSFIPVGETLSQITRIDTSGLCRELRSAEIITMCDIDNPLYGKTGAAYIFGPQKGADPAMVEYLDGQLRAVSETVKRDIGMDVSMMPGAGAAGGMGGGMVAFFGASLQMGIQVVLDTVGFESIIKDADMIITGEGKIDHQSLRGKVVIGIARRAKKLNVPVIAVVGQMDDNIEGAYDEGVTAIFSIHRAALPFSEVRHRNKTDLDIAMDNLFRLLARFGKNS